MPYKSPFLAAYEKNKKVLKNLLTNGKKHSIISYVRGSGGIGRRARLRGVCIPTYGFKSRLPHQTGKIRTLMNRGSYFSLQGITSVFKSTADKRIARSFYTRSYGLFSFIWLYTKPDFFCLSWWLIVAQFSKKSTRKNMTENLYKSPYKSSSNTWLFYFIRT